MEEVLNSTLVEIREGKAILLGTLDLALVFQIRVRTSSLHLARPKMWELPRRARFPPFCKDINICRVFQDGADIVYKMVRTKEIVYFPVCCLTIVLQNSETSDFSHLCVTRSYLRDEKTENYIIDISLRILTRMYCVVTYIELEHGPCYSLWV